MGNCKIDYWYGHKHKPLKYYADASFYSHGSFGYCYRGNIYNETGKMIGDYATNDSSWIEEQFIINFN